MLAPVMPVIQITSASSESIEGAQDTDQPPEVVVTDQEGHSTQVQDPTKEATESSQSDPATHSGASKPPVGSQSSGSGREEEEEEEEEEEPTIRLLPCLPAIKAAPPSVQEAKEGGVWGWTKFVFRFILFILSFPFMVLFTWTIPSCSIDSKWYRVTASFLMSIFWIAVLSFGMVTVVARLGCILSIGSFTMGLVVVAIGTSVPVSQIWHTHVHVQ